MSDAPYFNSGGFVRGQDNAVGVFLVDLDGNPYVASGGAGGGGGLVQMQLREGGSWVNAPGSAARGLLVDGASGTTDGAVGLPARADVVAGYDGANARVLKTSAAGVLQADVLTLPAGIATTANQATEIARLEAIRDRLPDTTATAAPSATDEGMVVHVATMPAGGGGSVAQYTEADTDASITGVAFLWEDASDTLRAVSAAKPLPVSGPLTDTQLRATPVPVSGTVTTGGLTDAQLRASAVPVDSELTTADLDTGAGTDTRAVVGLVRAESGGGLLVGSANPLPVSLATVPSHAVTNAGTFAVQVDGNALTALQLIDDTVFTDDAAFTVATSKVNAIGLMADQASTDSVNEGDIGIPRMTLDRKQITTVAPSNDTEGLDTFHLVSAASTNATSVKASPGKLYGWYIYNSNAAARKVAFHNTAGTPTAGSSVHSSVVIPPASGANVEFTNGIAFGTGIGITTVTDLTDAGATAVAANDLIINLYYK